MVMKMNHLRVKDRGRSVGLNGSPSMMCLRKRANVACGNGFVKKSERLSDVDTPRTEMVRLRSV